MFLFFSKMPKPISQITKPILSILFLSAYANSKCSHHVSQYLPFLYFVTFWNCLLLMPARARCLIGWFYIIWSSNYLKCSLPLPSTLHVASGSILRYSVRFPAIGVIFYIADRSPLKGQVKGHIYLYSLKGEIQILGWTPWTIKLV